MIRMHENDVYIFDMEEFMHGGLSVAFDNALFDDHRK